MATPRCGWGAATGEAGAQALVVQADGAPAFGLFLGSDGQVQGISVPNGSLPASSSSMREMPESTAVSIIPAQPPRQFSPAAIAFVDEGNAGVGESLSLPTFERSGDEFDQRDGRAVLRCLRDRQRLGRARRELG